MKYSSFCKHLVVHMLTLKDGPSTSTVLMCMWGRICVSASELVGEWMVICTLQSCIPCSSLAVIIGAGIVGLVFASVIITIITVVAVIYW